MAPAADGACWLLLGPGFCSRLSSIGVRFPGGSSRRRTARPHRARAFKILMLKLYGRRQLRVVARLRDRCSFDAALRTLSRSCGGSSTSASPRCFRISGTSQLSDP